MSEKRHELILIAFALLAAAGLILFVAFDSPPVVAGPVGYRENIAPNDKDEDFEALLSSYHELVGGDEGTMVEDGVTASADSKDRKESAKNGGALPSESYRNEQNQNYDKNSKINLNSASKSELMTLNGIGEVKAQAIIDYRLESGRFNSVDDLLKVTGIGPKTLEKIRDRLTV